VDGAERPDSLRLDVWLDVSCLFRTRSEAQKACKRGKVDVNGHVAKPHREIRPGDAISIARPLGHRQQVVVVGLADRHIPKAEARALYRDETPAPTAEEIEARRIDRLIRALGKPRASRSPDKRERRALRGLKERG
jgi:ribosome-associated heat shock protein Hsp15